MTKSQKISIHIFAILAAGIILFTIYQIFKTPEVTLGSVTQSSEYQSTTTKASWGTPNNIIVAQNYPGTLSAVTITDKNNNASSAFVLYDATTSDPALRGNTSTSSIIVARFGTSTPTGTYTFDLILKYGLVIELPSGVIATTTFTYR